MILPLAIHAMRTRFELVLVGDDLSRLRAVGEAALEEVARVESRLNRFSPSSDLTRVNRLAARAWVRVDAELFELLTLCEQLWRETEGAFDPTVGPLMRALGLQAACGLGGQALALAEARAAVGWGAVELDPERRALRFHAPLTALDLGAIGKGYALDLATAVLREHGQDCAILHGGTSTTVALGAPPGCAGWRIALGHSEGERPARVLELHDQALSLSALSVGSGSAAAARVHVLDPLLGQAASARSRVAISTRLAPCDGSTVYSSALRASLVDAWSTALLVRRELRPPADMIDEPLLASARPRGAAHSAHTAHSAFSSPSP